MDKRKIVIFGKRGVPAPVKDPNDVYENGTSASPFGEANSIGAWFTGGGTNSITSVGSGDTLADNGDYCIKIETTGGSGTFSNARWAFAATAGDTFDVTIRAKRGSVGTNQAFATFTNSTPAHTTYVTTTEWATYSWSITATATANIELKAFSGLDLGVVGDILYIDTITIIKTN